MVASNLMFPLALEGAVHVKDSVVLLALLVWVTPWSLVVPHMTFPPLMMLKEPRSAPVPSSLATIKYPTNTLSFSAVIVTVIDPPGV